MRGQPADYDGWAVNGATGWSWFDVLPYFLKSEDNKEINNGVSAQYHNTGGPMPVQKVDNIVDIKKRKIFYLYIEHDLLRRG